MPPDGHRSEGTLSLSEVPYAGAKPFGLPFRRLEKVTRRKGGTLISNTRSNGYAPTPNPKKTIRQVHSVQTFNTLPPIATATSSTAIKPKAKLKLLAWATKPITAGPARIPA